ncbi:hypothetical protein N9Z53_02005 [Mariniblastus sp.]|nr:hypothetical protein [bacterium]MDB4372527.1 hypothetical protein [Mariniblastus sp.]
MIRIIPIFICAFFISNVLHGQDGVSKERAMMERLESSIQIILSYDPAISNANLELVDDQKEKLAKLNDEYQKMIEEIVELQARGDEDSINASKRQFLKKMTTFQNTLHADILLPHQSDLLHSLVFAQFVKHRGGSILRAIETYYTREFGLTSEQKREMAQIDKQAAKKVAAAKERFRKELEKIANETNEDVRKVLSPEQAKTLDKFQKQ